MTHINDIEIDQYSIDVPNDCNNCKKLSTRKTLIHEFGRYKGCKYYDCYMPVGDSMHDKCDHFESSNHPETVEWTLDPRLIKITYEYIKEMAYHDSSCEYDIDFMTMWKKIYELFKPYLGDE